MGSDKDNLSGWGDEKQPMVVVAPGAGGGGGGNTRIVMVALVGALLLSLAIAGYSMWRLDGANRENAKAVETLKKDHEKALKDLEAKLARANTYLREDLDYIAALEADNLALRTPGAKPAATPPAPPARQKYINDLQAENLSRRTRGPRQVAITQRPEGYDAWKSMAQ